MPHFIVHQAVNFQRLMEGRLVSSFGRQTSSADKFEGKKKKERLLRRQLHTPTSNGLYAPNILTLS